MTPLGDLLTDIMSGRCVPPTTTFRLTTRDDGWGQSRTLALAADGRVTASTFDPACGHGGQAPPVLIARLGTAQVRRVAAAFHAAWVPRPVWPQTPAAAAEVELSVAFGASRATARLPRDEAVRWPAWAQAIAAFERLGTPDVRPGPDPR